MSVSITPTHVRMHHTNSIHTCSMLASNTHASHLQPSLLLICFCYQQLQTNPPSTPPFFVLSFSHNHPLPSLVAVGSLFLGFAISSFDVHCRNKITGHRGAWHFRLEKGAEALFSCLSDKHKKRAQLGTASQQMAFPGRELASVPGRDCKHAQAGHWQTFPGRELAKRPRQGLQSVPRQGTGKRSQAGNWQAFPGRELASVPGRDCKRAQAGHWQMFPGREL